jgi:hypothetical protein
MDAPQQEVYGSWQDLRLYITGCITTALEQYGVDAILGKVFQPAALQ